MRVDDHPEIMANLMPGTRVFRRAFWDEQGLAFATEGDHSDIVTIVDAMLRGRRVDILPSVVYRWGWREDNRSLWQQGLQDRRRVADRVAQICAAGELVAATASEPVQRAFFAEVLHTTVPDLVRAAITRDDGYWEVLGAELRRLLDLVSAETFPAVPVEDRIIAWLCAHDERDAAESFLEYAFDNQNGYPHRMVGARPHITLPFIDAICRGVRRAHRRRRQRAALPDPAAGGPLAGGRRAAPRGGGVPGVPRRRLRRERGDRRAPGPGLRDGPGGCRPSRPPSRTSTSGRSAPTRTTAAACSAATST